MAANNRWVTVRDTAKRAFAEFNRDNGSLMAAAISFYTLLSLVPMLLLAISVFGYFLHSRQDALTSVLDFVQGMLPNARAAVKDVIGPVIQARGVIGGFGLATLAWSAIQGLVTMEAAINVAWERPPRSFLFSRLFALGMVFVLGFLFLLTLAVTWAQATLTKIHGLEWLGASWLVQLSGTVVAILVSTAMFTTVYRTFPNTQVRWRPAVEAGVLCAVLFEIAKHLYTWYVTHLAHLSSVYGSLGSLIGLVTWIYYSNFLLLFGAEIARLRQRAVEGAAEQAAPAPQPPSRNRATA